MIIRFLGLLKPRIIVGNLISSLGGFFLASKGNINYYLLLLNLMSLSFVVGSSCVFNNVIDYKLDRLMNRTKNRILVTNTHIYNFAIFFAIFLGILGLFIFGWFINILCMVLSFLGLIIYVVFYSFFLKKRSMYSTIIGSISGAIPPVLGYCSVTNHIDWCAINLFFVLFLWQIPHSYAIFIMHLDDYKNANIPIFPVVQSLSITRVHMNIFILFFLVFSCLLTVTHCTGYKFFFILLIFSTVWFYIATKKYYHDNYITFSKSVFYCSIIIMLIMNVMMSIDFIR